MLRIFICLSILRFFRTQCMLDFAHIHRLYIDGYFYNYIGWRYCNSNFLLDYLHIKVYQKRMDRTVNSYYKSLLFTKGACMNTHFPQSLYHVER
jgi:hypothetical protein